MPFKKGNTIGKEFRFKKGNKLWDNPNTKIVQFKEGNRIGNESRFKEGHKHSNQVRGKMSEVWYNTHKFIYSDKYKEKCSKSHKGFKHDEKTKRKISDAKKGNYYGTGFQKGHLQFNTGKTYFRKGNAQSEFCKTHRKYQIFPKKDTLIELKIQNYLKLLGIDFFTHQYIKNIEHGYQCDILIPTLNLIIECDGNYWHKYPIGTKIDNIRTNELIEGGFKVLRLWENEIKVITLEEFKKKIDSTG